MYTIHGPPTLRTKVLQVGLLILLCTIFVYARRITQTHLRFPRSEQEVVDNKETLSEARYLARLVREYRLTDKVEWSAIRVRSKDGPSDWTSVTELSTEFFSNDPEVIDVRKPDRQKLPAQRQLEVPVPGSPLPGQIDASDFLFGISSTYDRVIAEDYALVKDWARWLTGGNPYGNGATFLLVLEQGTEKQIDAMSDRLAELGIDAYVTASSAPMSVARRYFEMIKVMRLFSTTLAQIGQHKKWFGLLDENIFLPNLAYLQDRLFSYNSDIEMYVGLPSDRSDWAIGSGYATTYGGGAVFLTRPAVSSISRLKCHQKENSDNTFRGKRWDNLLQECLMRQTEMTMTILPSFYSPRDDGAETPGADTYEMGVQALTLHHTEERHQVNPSIAHLVIDVCGEACFFQRYRFSDNWVLVNGYSITEYPDGLTIGSRPKSLSGRSPEKAGLSVLDRVVLDEDAAERKSLKWTGRRNVWRLMDSAPGKDGAVWQAYVKRGVAEDAPSFERSESEPMDSVIVLRWDNAAVSALV